MLTCYDNSPEESDMYQERDNTEKQTVIQITYYQSSDHQCIRRYVDEDSSRRPGRIDSCAC